MVPTNGAAHVYDLNSGISADGLQREAFLELAPRRIDADGVDCTDPSYDTAFRDAVRQLARKYVEAEHADLLDVNRRQLQRLVEHDALKTAFDSIVAQQERMTKLAKEVETRCNALLKLYPAEALKRDDQGGKALQAIQDLVKQIEALKLK